MIPCLKVSNVTLHQLDVKEIFIGNNSTSTQSFTSVTGPEDPLSGKLFDTGIINSKGMQSSQQQILVLGLTRSIQVQIHPAKDRLLFKNSSA